MTTEQRIQRLERTNRRYRWGITIVIFAAMIVGAADAGDDVPDVIRARKFEVVNEEGVPVVVMQSYPLGGWFHVTGNKGNITSSIGHNDAGNGLVQTASAKGTVLVMLSATDNGGGFHLCNKTNDEVIQMRADEYGNGYLGVFDRKGKGRVIQPGP